MWVCLVFPVLFIKSELAAKFKSWKLPHKNQDFHGSFYIRLKNQSILQQCAPVPHENH